MSNSLRLTAFSLLALISSAFAQTTLSGDVYDGHGGPLISLMGNYVAPTGFKIPPNKTLTIEPGVAVHVGAASRIDIYGTLAAIGDSSKHIHFTNLTTGTNWADLYELVPRLVDLFLAMRTSNASYAA